MISKKQTKNTKVNKKILLKNIVKKKSLNISTWYTRPCKSFWPTVDWNRTEKIIIRFHLYRQKWTHLVLIRHSWFRRIGVTCKRRRRRVSIDRISLGFGFLPSALNNIFINYPRARWRKYSFSFSYSKHVVMGVIYLFMQNILAIKRP